MKMLRVEDQDGHWRETWAGSHHALASCLALKKLEDIPDICWHLGRAHTALEQYNLASLYLQVGRKLSEQQNVTELTSRILLEEAVLAKLSPQSGNFQSAMESVFAAVFPSAQDSTLAGKAAMTMFQDGIKNQRWRDDRNQPIKSHLIHSSGFYEVSLELNRKLGDKQGIAMSLVNLGDVWRKLGKNGNALVCWREALTYLSELGDQGSIETVNQWIKETGEYVQPTIHSKEEKEMTLTIESLLNDLDESYNDDELRQKAIEEFDKIREGDTPEVAKLLVRRLENSNEDKQYAARDALGKLGESAIPVLVSFIAKTGYDDSRRYAETALREIRAKGSNNKSAQEQTAEIVGRWVVLNSSVELEISFSNGSLQFEGWNTDNDEKINIREPKWDGQTLEMTTVVPSTGWTIHDSMRLTNPNTMKGTYSGNASGNQIWKRKGKQFTPDN
jgi:tetratricopeptide (TPR) repeat protein